MASHEHHAGHGHSGAGHNPATDQLSPNEHRQHAEPDEHGGPGGHGGHGEHGGHGDHAAQFRDRFWLSLILSIPVVAYSEMVQEWLRFTPPQFPGSRWVAPVLGTIVFVYGGRVFLEGGLAELRSRQPGMMLLISLAIMGRLRRQRRDRVRRLRPGFLVGAGAADRDHAARPLAGDACPRPGLQRPGRPGRAAAG
jgi:Cu2+-exporting ATPase